MQDLVKPEDPALLEFIDRSGSGFSHSRLQLSLLPGHGADFAVFINLD